MAELTAEGAGRAVPAALVSALNQMFYAVLQVDPADDRVTVLQSRDHPGNEGSTGSWSARLARYGGIMTNQGDAMLRDRFSSQALLAAARNGEREISMDLSYFRNGQTNCQ